MFFFRKLHTLIDVSCILLLYLSSHVRLFIYLFCIFPFFFRLIWFDCEIHWTELNDKGAWTALNYVSKFDQFWKFEDNCERIHVKDVNCDEFIERFEKPYKPVVIEGIQVSFDQIRHFSLFATFIWKIIPTGQLEGQWEMDIAAIGEKVPQSKIQVRRGQRRLQCQNENEVLYRLHANN